MIRSCRLASADFCLLVLGSCFAAAVQAADAPAVVTPPKPVVLQPTAVMAPPPPVPEAAEATPTPAAKGGKVKKTAKTAKATKPAAKPAKPAGKPKAKGKAR
jgi:2-oxoglutarate decarboxylase